MESRDGKSLEEMRSEEERERAEKEDPGVRKGRKVFPMI
jgi:hypothetical protein